MADFFTRYLKRKREAMFLCLDCWTTFMGKDMPVRYGVENCAKCGSANLEEFDNPE